MVTINHTAYMMFCCPGADPDSLGGKRMLTEQQEKVYRLYSNGWNPKRIAKRTNMSVACVYDAIHKIRHNGWA